MADLVKAFNLLPRYPVFAMCAAMGVDGGLIRAWSGALCLLRCRFNCLVGGVVF